MFFYLQTMHFDSPALPRSKCKTEGPSPSQPTTIPLPRSKCETEGAVSFKPTSVHFHHSTHETEGLFPKPPPSPSLAFRVRRRGSSPSHNPPPSLPCSKSEAEGGFFHRTHHHPPLSVETRDRGGRLLCTHPHPPPLRFE